ncbi:hypothetical protein [Liquorilactobacillus uvarum]|uniref:Uncharacterized protein n=1 Tax=Liquorilactobacillus uvarum DSM 19971 TaxID=1423812 RepID=A0A0R1PTS6_9LACO|nr:hypothetical protein [Liquorilactobacillus uvarum]KRL33090.1 hypothetical protein FD20_GL002024 [Liquorilactobacillus uvarum DSM 19971]
MRDYGKYLLFLLAFVVTLFFSNKVMLQMPKALVSIIVFGVLSLLVFYFDKHFRKRKTISKILLIFTWLSLFLVVAYTHENYWSTKNVYGTQMFYSKCFKVKIDGKNYVLTTQSHSFTIRTYFFNLYQREGLFYRRVNRKYYFVYTKNMHPDKSSVWIFKNTVLKNVHNLQVDPKTAFYYQPIN